MSDTKNEAKLNKKAEELFASNHEKRNVGKDQCFSDKKITTSYYAQSEYVDSLDACIYAVYVYQPLKIAVKKHVSIYIIGAIVLTVIETVCIYLKNTLLPKQSEAE